mgnify:CR=1 FL=1
MLKKSARKLQNYLKYEFVLYPLALFNEKAMRKDTKSDHTIFSSVRLRQNFNDFTYPTKRA